jgi:hypothetical protein
MRFTLSIIFEYARATASIPHPESVEIGMIKDIVSQVSRGIEVTVHLL